MTKALLLVRTSRHLKSGLLFTVILLLGRPLSAAPYRFDHTPPTMRSGLASHEAVDLTLPAEGVKRARVLVEQPIGYKVIPMMRTGMSLRAPVSFDELAEIVYRLQVETENGELYISNSYALRQPSNTELESEIRELTVDIEGLQARSVQLENSLHSLRTADPQALAKQKSKEVAKALVALSKREREYEEISRFVAEQEAERRARIENTEHGKKVKDARSFLEQEAAYYWSR